MYIYKWCVWSSGLALFRLQPLKTSHMNYICNYIYIRQNPKQHQIHSSHHLQKLILVLATFEICILPIIPTCGSDGAGPLAGWPGVYGPMGQWGQYIKQIQIACLTILNPLAMYLFEGLQGPKHSKPTTKIIFRSILLVHKLVTNHLSVRGTIHLQKGSWPLLLIDCL